MLCKYPVAVNKFSDACRPCGQCLACRINKRRIWSHRIVLESQYHPYNSFLTLTYDDDHIPKEFSHPKTGEIFAAGSVNPEHHRLFINRFRTAYKRKTGEEIRFYAIGEYGEKTMRPHYHYALFNYPPCMSNGHFWTGNKFNPCRCPSCSFISDHWGQGHIFLGSLTLDSANYVAGYVTKKLTSNSTAFQRDILQGRHPEFPRMSRNPGIGSSAVNDISSTLTRYRITTHDELPRHLLHGSKALPLGRYLTDKLCEEMGIVFEEGQKLSEYEKNMRFMLLHNPSLPDEIKKAAGKSLPTALQFLNSQKVLNLEAKRQLFNKEKTI